MKKPKKIKDNEDLVGRVFGEQTVIDRAPGTYADGQRLWVVRCSCGSIRNVPTHRLLVSESCGCKHKQRQSEYMKEHAATMASKEDRLISAKKCNAKTIVDGVKVTTLNGKLFKNNTSGYKGVCWKHNKWEASVGYKKKRYYLLRSDDIRDCIQIRQEAVDAINGGYFESWIEGIQSSR